jgi:hypothetical protein
MRKQPLFLTKAMLQKNRSPEKWYKHCSAISTSYNNYFISSFCFTFVKTDFKCISYTAWKLVIVRTLPIWHKISYTFDSSHDKCKKCPSSHVLFTITCLLIGRWEKNIRKITKLFSRLISCHVSKVIIHFSNDITKFYRYLCKVIW